MSYRLIVDSCCDKTAPMANWNNITFIPLTLELGNYRIFDDENFDQDEYIKKTIEFGGVPKTACPSPEAWAKALECDEDEIFIITITSHLSGTYNSALQGVELYNEEHPDSSKKIHVFNSCATSGKESLIAEKIVELASNGDDFDTIISKIDDMIKNHSVLYFCLESLDVLKNNGRLFALAASVLEKLRVKLICKEKEGNISLATQDLNMNRAMVKIAKLIADDVKDVDLADKKIIISHVCCEERAKLLADKIANYCTFGSVEIIKCSGLNSTYASNGGIIVSYTK